MIMVRSNSVDRARDSDESESKEFGVYGKNQVPNILAPT
jgi:hypothetical protein